MFYVISPPGASDWSVDRDVLVQLLEQSWPDIAVELDSSLPTRDVAWRIAMPEGDLEGSQDREGQAQYLNGPVASLASYARWWRQQVPDAQALVLYDESYSSVVPLDPGVEEEDLVRSLE